MLSAACFASVLEVVRPAVACWCLLVVPVVPSTNTAGCTSGCCGTASTKQCLLKQGQQATPPSFLHVCSLTLVNSKPKPDPAAAAAAAELPPVAQRHCHRAQRQRRAQVPGRRLAAGPTRAGLAGRRAGLVQLRMHPRAAVCKWRVDGGQGHHRGQARPDPGACCVSQQLRVGP